MKDEKMVRSLRIGHAFPPKSRVTLALYTVFSFRKQTS